MHDQDYSRLEVDEPAEGELKAAEHMARELHEGVRHGYFEMTVIVETGQSKKKYITIKAGKSYRFIV